jgi:ABC-2 type transport system permease protein
MRLVDKGVPSGEIEALLKNIRLRTLRVTETGAKEDRGLGGFLLSFFFTMVLYSTLIFYGVAVMRGIIEEKSSRIFEVLLSSVKPIQLMAGKILGLAAVGLTQYLVWAIMIGLAGGGFGIAALSQLGEMNVTPLMLGAFVVYFLLGYVLYSALYAALGAAVNTEQEAQQLQFFVVILLVAPLILQQMVMRNPSSTASVALSLVPFFAPLLMFLRITIQTPPAWQLALSVALMIATGALVMWACARIYRVGILMYGKRPTLPELWRWFRTA